MDWQKVSGELAKPLSPDAVKPPAPGKFGDYVEAIHVIREANRIFGFNGWKYETKTIQLTNASENNGKHFVGYMAIVEVDVDGVTRSDVGHGQGFGQSEGNAHDSAVKEAVTDALKRALRTFGNTFGLALYEKTNRQVGYTADTDEITEAIGWINNCGDMGQLHEMWRELFSTRRNVAENNQVIAAKDARKEALQKEAE